MSDYHSSRDYVIATIDQVQTRSPVEIADQKDAQRSCDEVSEEDCQVKYHDYDDLGDKLDPLQSQ